MVNLCLLLNLYTVNVIFGRNTLYYRGSGQELLSGQIIRYNEKRTHKECKTAAKGSRIVNHAWSYDHVIDFNNMSIIDKGSSHIRKFLES